MERFLEEVDAKDKQVTSQIAFISLQMWKQKIIADMREILVEKISESDNLRVDVSYMF